MSPTPPIAAGLLADFDPNAGAVTVASTKVSSFVSRVNGHAVVQALAGSQPAWSATAINGRPGILYDGVDDFLDGASALAGLLAGTAPYTAYWIGALTGAGATFMTPWSMGLAADNTRWVQSYKNATSDVDSYGRSDATGTFANNAAVTMTTAAFDHYSVFTGAAYTSAVNGVVSYTNSPNTKAPALDRFTMGALAYGATSIQPWGGTLGRLLIYGAVHAAPQIAQTRAWLRARYGL